MSQSEGMPKPKPTDQPIRQVKWPEAEKFAATRSQLWDFDVALQALAAIRQVGSSSALTAVLNQALYTTALISYARVFKSGVRNGCTVDDLALSDDDRAEHDRLIALRDKWLAHSVNALDQVAVGIHLSGFGNDSSVVDVVSMRLRAWGVSPNEAERIENFVRSVRKQVEAYNNDVYQTLLDRARGTPIAELQALPEISLVVPDHDLDTVSKRRKW